MMKASSMDTATCERAQLARQDAAGQRVGDVMVARPKTLPADASVGAARHFFENPKVVSAVLVDGDEFVGVLSRGDLPDSAAAASPARAYADREVATVTPDQPMSEALAELDARGTSRLVVLADDGVTLAGLLCLDRQRSGFCRE